MEEIWKPMVGKEKFLVSNFGRIMRAETQHIYPVFINHEGYAYCSMCDNGKSFVARCHREVAKAFVPNPDGKEQVNHKDGNKLNNCVENLEWCTAKENVVHAINVLGHDTRVGSKKLRKPVICVETGIVYDGCKKAREALGIKSNGHIEACCKGVRKTCYGFHWKYI